jgi:hypothetical protein
LTVGEVCTVQQASREWRNAIFIAVIPDKGLFEAEKRSYAQFNMIFIGGFGPIVTSACWGKLIE